MRLARLSYTAALALALSSSVYAQSATEIARAADLKKQGDELVHASKFHEALKAYDDSFAIVANPAIHYNRGRALEGAGDYPEALDALDKFVATAPPELRARVPNLDKTMADIASHVATFVINCPIDGATVLINGKTVTTPTPPIRTVIGDVSIHVTAPGRLPFDQNVTVAGGSTTTVDVDLKIAHGAPTKKVEPEPEPNPRTPETEAAGGSGWRTFAFVSGGLGLASLGAGLLFMGLALSDKGNADPHCPNKVCDPTGRASINEAQTFATVSTVLVVVGSVALATSVLSFIVAPKSAPVQARLFIGPGFATAYGSF